MRSHNDLFGAFDSVDTDSVDPDEMLARVHTGSAALQTARRRRVAVLSVTAAAILLAVGAVVVPSLGNDRSDRGQVATTPSGTPIPGIAGTAPELSFTVRERPPGYPIESMSARPGFEQLSFHSSDDPNTSNEILILLFDPRLPDAPVPAPVGEILKVESVSSGPLSVQVLDNPRDGPYTTEFRFGIGWENSDGRWMVIRSSEQAELARQDVLTVAAQVDLEVPRRFTFPFHLGYVPDGFAISGAGQLTDGDGGLETSYPREVSGLRFQRPPQYPNWPTELLVSAAAWRGVPEWAAVNTTVGPYEAELTTPQDSGAALTLFDVHAFMTEIRDITPGEDSRLDEADLRRIAESIVIIPDAANDMTVWTDQPIG